MAAKLLEGKPLAEKIKAEVRAEVEALAAKGCRVGLSVVLVGEDPASAAYVRGKEKDCADCGIHSEVLRFADTVEEAELLKVIKTLNADPAVHGILVQLPLPKHIDEQTLLTAVDPAKDVDGFHPVNAGLLLQGHPAVLPCTPAGILYMLQQGGVPMEGARCVVIGRSNIVGKPTALLLLSQNGTVTLCHSKTKDLAALCKEADILVAAVGKVGFVTADMVKPGAAVIDVGVNRGDDGKLRGDVDFAAVEPVAGWLTPVPGGVGLLTRAMLLRNAVQAAKTQLENR